MINLLFFLRRRRRRPLVAQTELRTALRNTVLYLAVIFAAHVVAMIHFENMSGGDALWLTLTTITTVGYGDMSAATAAGRASTVSLIYLGGIFVLAKVAGDYFDFRAEKRLRKMRGEWDWNMRGHIVIMNTPSSGGEQYFIRLIEQFRASERFRHHPVQILTTAFHDGLPQRLSQLGDVVHYHGRADEADSLEAVNVSEADAIVVLAQQEYDRGSDSWAFDVLHRLDEAGAKGTILAECVDDRNRERLQRAGADIVIRPVRSYPEMIVRGFVAPGSERIIENMFTSSADEYLRFDLPLEDLAWKEVVQRAVACDLGTPVAYVDKEDELHCNPPALTRVKAKAVILMARDDNRPTANRVTEALIQNA